MLELPPLERGLFFGILILSAISSVLAHVQIVKDEVRFRRLLTAFVSLELTIGAVLLILRAMTIKAFPITSVFESMLILMVFIGITFIFLLAYVQRVWFLSVMAWSLFVITLLAAIVAKPAVELREAARTPWVIVHALSMALSAAMIVFATAMSVLFLWSRKRLKSKQFLTLFGKMPTIEKLEKLNLLGLYLSFAAMTLGLVSGVGMVPAKSAGLGMSLGDWLTDSKIVLVGAAWVILLCTLILRRLLGFSGKTVAHATLIVCFLILFAFIGSRIFCKSEHDFAKKSVLSYSVNRDVLCRLY